MHSTCSVTTHVMDTTKGLPVDGVKVTLTHFGPHQDTKRGVRMDVGVTNGDGRCAVYPPEEPLLPGRYQITYDVKSYYDSSKSILESDCFYPSINVEFFVPESKTDERFHLPLLLSPFGYSTYRGS